MQKNWYIIYTKPKCEKKVATLLTKKKIEIFLPLNLKKIDVFRRQKNIQEPLFKSYVFVRAEEYEIEKIKSINGVLNLLYWKGNPAVIKDEEIKAIKDFTAGYENICLEKKVVNHGDMPRILDRARYSFSGNVLSIKNTLAKLSLPSLGFTLVANTEAFDQFNSVPSFSEENLLLQS